MENLVSRWGKAFLIVVFCSLLFNLGMGLQNSTKTNFAMEDLKLNEEQFGWVEGIRELPGLLTVVLAVPAAYMAGNVYTAMTVLITGLGLLLYARSGTFSFYIIATLIYSTGFHLFSPAQQALVLNMSKPEEKASRLGLLNSVAAVGTLLASLLVSRMGAIWKFRDFYYLGTVVFLVAAIFIYFARRGGEKVEVRKAYVFRWKYKNYYFMQLLVGARRHINSTFAALALVSLHNVPVTTIASLMLISNLTTIFTRPLLGKIIDRWGEGKALTFNYSVVAVLFLCYAFVSNTYILYAIFIIDHVFLGFEVAITTFLCKIAPASDIAPSLAMGSSINHITGVLMPIVGGYLWTISPIATFVSGSFLSLCSLYQSWKLPTPDSINLAAD